VIKGSKHLQKSKDKLSKSQINRFANMTADKSECFSKAVSKAMKQRWAVISEEEKESIAAKKSKSQKRWLASLTKQERLGINHRMSEGAKEKYSKMSREERIKECANRPNFGANIKDWYANLTPEEFRTRNRNVSKGIRKWMSLLTEEEMYKHFRLQANPSSIEKKIWDELDKLGIRYETQVPFVGNRFIVDIYISAQRLIIECNGTYWHNYKIFPKKKIRDEAVDKWAARNGYRIIWLWETEIRKDPKQALKMGLRGVNLAI